MTADVVVIGAGHNGLAAAVTLARDGMSVDVVESEIAVGGMARTREIKPGVHCHPHAALLGYAPIMPLRRELESAGLRISIPAVQHAIAFEDGRPGVVIHRRDLLDRTRASANRYSRTDAELLVELLHRSERLTGALEVALRSPPEPATARDVLAATVNAYAGLPVIGALGRRTAVELIEDCFRSTEIRTLLLALAHELGGDIEASGSDLGFLSVVMWMIGRRAVPIGGMQSVVDAYGFLATHAGARILTETTVERVLVRDGRAAGVILDSGLVLRARKAVISTLGRAQTSEMAGLPAPANTQAPPLVVKQHLITNRPPIFRSASGEPDVDEAAQVFFGWDSPEELHQRIREVKRGEFPTPGGVLIRPSVADPSQRMAPGSHLSSIDSTFPGEDRLTADERISIADVLAPATYERLCRYTIGLGPSELIAAETEPLIGVNRHITMADSSDHFRLPVPGLYLGGSAVHPGGGVHGACGVNAAEAVLSSFPSVR